MVQLAIRCGLVGLFLGICVRPASAVLVAESQLFPETTAAPADDPGWTNIGELGASTAIYLGNRWVVSARHVPMGPVTLNGVTYEAEAGSLTTFANDSGTGLSKDPDLAMFRLQQDPGLPPLLIGRETPAAGQDVVVIGNGLDPAEEIRHWNVTQRGSVWTWNDSSEPGDYAGYHTQPTTTIRWGTNLLEDEENFGREFDSDIQTSLKTRSHHTVTILTEFDSPENLGSDDDVVDNAGLAHTRYESQAVLNDSGGALFSKSGSDDWQLSGVVLSVEGHPDQPDVTRYAIFGSITYYADLSTYLPQIEEHYVFGDLDGDLKIDSADIDLLTSASRSGEYDAQYDFNRDMRLDIADRQLWVTNAATTFFGDADLDGEFGTSDLVLVLQAGLYEDSVDNNASWSTGDWDGDGDFGTEDLVLALQSGGFEQGPMAAAVRTNKLVNAAANTAQVVPEPATGGWFLGLLLWIASSSRRRSARAR